MRFKKIIASVVRTVMKFANEAPVHSPLPPWAAE
jgi:hypothetical protein